MHHIVHQTKYMVRKFIPSLKITSKNVAPPCDHIVLWTSHKQQRIYYSSFGAMIVATENRDDRVYDFKMSLLFILSHRSIKHQHRIDSQALFETIKAVYKSDYYRRRNKFVRLRVSLES